MKTLFKYNIGDKVKVTKSGEHGGVAHRWRSQSGKPLYGIFSKDRPITMSFFEKDIERVK